MIRTKYITYMLQAFIWIPILVFSSLLIHNSLLYYTFDQEYGILPEKAEAMRDTVWKVAFYIHVVAGVVCLAVPVFSFLGKYLRLGIRFHQQIGKVYVWNSILIVAPTGMYIALYAKGGFAAQSGFMVQGILLSLFTFLGYKAIQKRDTDAHINWMIRSYAIATAVLTFRIYHVMFFFLSIPYDDIYGLSQWLSVVGNALLAEMVITYRMSIPKCSI